LARGLFFFRKFLREPGPVAAVWPSSRWLARAMVRGLDLRSGDVVLEFGPGTGSFTAALAPLAATGVRYLGVERDADFHRHLRARFPCLSFQRGTIGELDLEALLAGLGLGNVAAIVSGLPFASMPSPSVHAILATSRRVLRDGGSFRTFSYVHSLPTPGLWRLREELRRHFGTVRTHRPVLRNLPPAYVIEARS
jgi:phospholipid N-methyltransferase